MTKALVVVATVALDARDEAVLAGLAALARRVPLARVELLHVGEAAAVERVRELAERVRSECAAHVDGRVLDGRVDRVADAVLDDLHADLLVVGRSESGPHSGWGEHGLALLRAAERPVLVIPEGTTVAFSTAFVGMDLSDAAFTAMEWAERLCERVVAVAVVAQEDLVADSAGVLADLEARYDASRTARGRPPSDLRVTSGPPADALLALAPECDLLAVGSRGLTPLAAAVLGSTAERLGGRAPCPVLVVRPPGAGKGLLGALFGA